MMSVYSAKPVLMVSNVHESNLDTFYAYLKEV